MRRFSSRRVRTKREGQWAGNNLDTSAAGGSINVFPIWDITDSETVNMAGVATTRRIVGDIGFGNGDNATRVAHWYLMVFPTNDAGAVPAEIVFDPAAADADGFRKRVLARGAVRLAASSEVLYMHNLHIDVKAKHRMTQQDELVLVTHVVSLTGSNATASSLCGSLRAYCSW